MTKTILVVEDDKSVARMLQDVLTSEGFAVLVERDGEWGLRTFQKADVDLVIVDALIPKVKGFDLIARLREQERGKTLPVVVVSGVYRAEMHRERIKTKFGIVEYLDKPVDLDRLIDVLHDVFSSGYPVPGEPPRASGARRLLAEAARSAQSAQDRSRGGFATPTRAERRHPASGGGPSTGATKPLSIPDRGDLEQIPFARLLGALFAARSTGVLLLRKGSVKKIVYLRRGVPVFVKSNLLQECLGRVMVAERLITQAECDRSLEKKRELGRKQGELLVEMGSISPHNLEFALELQMQTKLFDLFSWLEGKYQFVAKDDYHGPQVALSLSPAATIYEGAGRTMSPERVRRELARIDKMRVAPSRDPALRYQALELHARGAEIIERIDGRRSIRELLDGTDILPDEANLLVYALACTSLLEILEAEPERPQGSADVRSDPQGSPIVVDDADVEMLSTAEINAIAELGKVEKIAQPSPPAFDEAETLRGAEIAAAKAQASNSLRANPLSSIQEDAGERAPASAVPGVEASVDSDEEPTTRPAPEEVPAPPSDSEGGVAEGESPILSDEIRRQVRARLEAEAAKLVAPRTPEGPTLPLAIPGRAPVKTSPSQRIQAPRVDVEREWARLRRELTERLERMRVQNHYEILGVHRRASFTEIRVAYDARAREDHPDRVVPATASREIRALAERIHVSIRRAFDTLSDAEAKIAYDRQFGDDPRDERIAPIVAAEQSFSKGRAASEEGDWERAKRCFSEAAELNMNEGVYLAHLGFATFRAAPDDPDARQRALGFLDRALDLSPRAEELYVFRGTIHQKNGEIADARRSFERALFLNPDSPEAIQALREIEPPVMKKSGILSRLTLGGGGGS